MGVREEREGREENKNIHFGIFSCIVMYDNSFGKSSLINTYHFVPSPSLHSLSLLVPSPFM